MFKFNSIGMDVRLLATSLVIFGVLVGCSFSQVAGKTSHDHAASATAPVASGSYPPFGFTSFPYSFDIEAIERTHQIARDHGGIYAIHRDNGIPWYEALNDLPYPKKVQDTWRDYKNRRPKGMPVYLGLGPLGEDRETLIHGSEGSQKPGIFNGRKLDDAEVIKAYTQYVFKAMENFDPDFLNLGIEVGELAYRNPRAWGQFATLYSTVAAQVKAKYPDVSIGISFGLHTLLEDGVLERSAVVIDKSDYIGLSFYPYMSQFHERYGASPLPAPPQEWRGPLEKLNALVNKPIAICETGYSSVPVAVPKHKLSFAGSPALQDQYLGELADFASRDGYLFVVWFMPVDYNKLFESLPQGDGTYLIWQNIGLYDKDLNEKPALKTWDSINKGVRVAGAAPVGRPEIMREKRPNNFERPSEPIKEPTVAGNNGRNGGHVIRFDGNAAGFQGSKHDDLKPMAAEPRNTASNINQPYLRWSFTYNKKRPQYIAKEVGAEFFANRSSISFPLKSNQSGAILLQLEERNGEAFFVVLKPTEAWELIELDFSTFALSQETRKDGKLTANQIVKILIADLGGQTDGASGNRHVDIGSITIN